MPRSEFLIQPAAQQSLEATARFVLGLKAPGGFVATDTSTSPYRLRVDEATYRNWQAALPKPPPAASEAAAQPADGGEATGSDGDNPAEAPLTDATDTPPAPDDQADAGKPAATTTTKKTAKRGGK